MVLQSVSQACRLDLSTVLILSHEGEQLHFDLVHCTGIVLGISFVLPPTPPPILLEGARVPPKRPSPNYIALQSGRTFSSYVAAHLKYFKESHFQHTKLLKLRGLSSRANYNDRATAALSAKLVPSNWE
jgi:hypothetical protein